MHDMTKPTIPIPSTHSIFKTNRSKGEIILIGDSAVVVESVTGKNTVNLVVVAPREMKLTNLDGIGFEFPKRR
jgi:hypothetical protein